MNHGHQTEHYTSAYVTSCMNRHLQNYVAYLQRTTGVNVLKPYAANPIEPLNAPAPPPELVQILTNYNDSTPAGSPADATEINCVWEMGKRAVADDTSNLVICAPGDPLPDALEIEGVWCGMCAYQQSMTRLEEMSNRLLHFFHQNDQYSKPYPIITNEDLFIVMNNLVGNLVQPIVQGAIMVGTEVNTPVVNAEAVVYGDTGKETKTAPPLPPAYGNEDFDRAGKEAKTAPPLPPAYGNEDFTSDRLSTSYKEAIASAEVSEGMEAAMGTQGMPQLIDDMAVSLQDVVRVRRLANITILPNECEMYTLVDLSMALLYWQIEHDRAVYDTEMKRREDGQCCCFV
jgi:hypothetical protein